MEVLLIFALFISPASHSEELPRFEKRAAGFDQHLAELSEAEERRIAQAAKQRQVRRKQFQDYEYIRDNFKRPKIARDPQLETAYLEMREARLAEELRKQADYAIKRRQDLEAVGQRAAILKPREYNIKGDTP